MTSFEQVWNIQHRNFAVAFLSQFGPLPLFVLWYDIFNVHNHMQLQHILYAFMMSPSDVTPAHKRHKAADACSTRVVDPKRTRRTRPYVLRLRSSSKAARTSTSPMLIGWTEASSVSNTTSRTLVSPARLLEVCSGLLVVSRMREPDLRDARRPFPLLA